MTRNLRSVILNESEESRLIDSSIRRDPSAAPQDDVATRSLFQKGEGGFLDKHEL
jgi:hypothetical protein